MISFSFGGTIFSYETRDEVKALFIRMLMEAAQADARVLSDGSVVGSGVVRVLPISARGGKARPAMEKLIRKTYRQRMNKPDSYGKHNELVREVLREIVEALDQ